MPTPLNIVRENIGKMIDKGAGESDLQEYVRLEGYSKDDVKNYKPPEIRVLDKIGNIDLPGKGFDLTGTKLGRGIVGMGRGFVDAGEGIKQASLESGVQMGMNTQGDLDQYNQDVRQERALYNDTPSGQSTSSKVGRFAGNTAPFMAVPVGTAGGLALNMGKMAGLGGAMGAAGYVNEGDSRIGNAAMGATIGAAVPAAFRGLQKAPVLGQKGIQKLFRGKATGDQVRQNLDDFAMAGAKPSAGQATENNLVQAVTNVSGKVPGGVTKAQNFAENLQDDLGKKAFGMAEELSGKSDIDAEFAGRVMKRGIENFVDRFKTKSGSLYDKIDNQIKPEAPILLRHTKETLNKLTSKIDDNPELAKALNDNKINEIAKSLAESNTLQYGSFKELRSAIGRKLGSSELITGAPKAELKRLYGSLAKDMEAAMFGSQREMAKRANKYYSAGLTRMDDFLDGIVKKSSPEEIFQAATNKTRIGATKLRTLKRSLLPEEWEVVSAKFIDDLGRATGGKQNAIGSQFSSETFLTNWNNKVSNAAKNTLFGGSVKLRAYRRDLDAIARVSEKIRSGSGVLANPSGTGGLMGQIAYGTMGGAGIASGSFAPVALVGGLMGSANLTQRLMQNQSFVNWLGKSIKMPKHQINNSIQKLVTIAAKEFSDEDQESVNAYIDAVSGSGHQ